MPGHDYTKEFWDRAYKLQASEPKCEMCGTLPQPKIRGTKLDHGVREVRVRVVLDGAVPSPKNLHLRCTRCHPVPVPLKISRKAVLEKILPLPFEGASPNAK